jgi:endonuclease-3
MTSVANRAEKYNKLYKIARKHFQPVLPPSNRSVLEHIVYACCLEDSTYESADEVFAKLLENYFDWNEIRVTTSLELAEIMKGLHDPHVAATRLRKALQGLFESRYSFDAEFLKKENLGKAMELLSKYKGCSTFGVGYVAQLALNGHSIPADHAMLSLMYVVGAITTEEMAQQKIPGLERTIPKNKGPEFSSLVHQLAVSFLASPFEKSIRDLVLQIDPTADERFPKRGGGRKKVAPAPEPVKSKPTGGEKMAGKTKKGVTPQSPLASGKNAKPKQPAKKVPNPPKKDKSGKTAVKKNSSTGKLATKKPR